MLRWSWNKIMGELTLKGQRIKDGKPFTYKKRLYAGNCLAVLGELAYDNGMGKPYKKPRWTVYSEFWNDKEHLEKCLGLKPLYDGKKENFYRDAKKITLNSYYFKDTYMKADMKAIMDAFVKAHIPVEIVYKEPKETKKNNK